MYYHTNTHAHILAEKILYNSINNNNKISVILFNIFKQKVEEEEK